MEKTDLKAFPLISVCIPAYNCEKYVGEAIRSVLNQSYSSLEVIVINDGSTDDTLNHIFNIKDERVKCITTTNKGAAAARNLAFENSKGEYLIFFDADDLLPAEFIQKLVTRTSWRNDVIVLSSWGRFYNDDISTFKKETIPYNEMRIEDWVNTYWYQGTPMTAPGRAIIPKQLMEQSGLWNEELSLNDDLEFYTRLFIKADKILFCNDTQLYYRSGIGGLSGHKSDEAYRSLYRSISLSIDHVLQKIGDDSQIKQSCANLLQGFIHELYPHHQELVDQAQKQMQKLGTADLKFMAGGITKIMVSFLGWKLTKRLKSFLGK